MRNKILITITDIYGSKHFTLSKVIKKILIFLIVLFALSACTVGKKCTYTQDGTKISSWVWIMTDGKPIDLDKNNCN